MHEIAENVIVNLYQDSYLVSLCDKRNTLFPIDMKSHNEKNEKTGKENK